MIDELLASGEEKLAIECANGELSYSKLLQITKHGSRELIRRKLCQGDVVAIKTNERLAFFILLLTCFRHGLSVVPLSPDASEQDIRYYKEIAKVKVIFESISDMNINVSKELDGVNEVSPDYSEAAKLITFSSGTTGKPKGIVHPVANLIACAKAFSKHMGMQEGSRCLHHMPHFYMAGILNTFFCPLVGKGTVVLADIFSARNAGLTFKNIIERRCDYTWLSPTMLTLCVKLTKSDETISLINSRKPFLFIGTAPLNENCKNLYSQRYSAPLLESYGTSELLIISCQKTNSSSSNNVGEPLEEVHVSLASDGELLIDSPWAMSCYLNAPENGRATGDLGILDAEQRLSIIGRKKDLIIKGGVNISPTAIEEVALKHPDVDDACVVARPHPLWGEVPVLFVILQTSGKKNALIDFLRANLPADRVPDAIYEVEAFPRTVTGKVVKNKLLAELSS